MKILHTADTHIGRLLHNLSRYEEFEQFFSWLIQIIIDYDIQVLLIAGDVFDNATPSNRSMQIYYRFLANIAENTACQHVVIIGGNHDSALVLGSSQDILAHLNIHVVGGARENITDEVLVLSDHEDNPMLIVCAVPFLKERDVRLSYAGETEQEKTNRVIEGISHHYSQIFSYAQQLREELGGNIPVIAMGHLYTMSHKGEESSEFEGDGVRELYIGSLSHVPAAVFPLWLDYIALGHLHIPHYVSGRENMRYSGSPLALGFQEALHRKSVTMIEITPWGREIEIIEVPVFQKILTISGDWEQIEQQLRQEIALECSVWVQVCYIGNKVIGQLRQKIMDLVSGTQVYVVKVEDTTVRNEYYHYAGETMQLHQLDPLEVFDQFLIDHEIPLEQQEGLKNIYTSVVSHVQSEEQEKSVAHQWIVGKK